jgi:L-alanine-DL-glutamate epimerase-like enolase superfamily enzyme
VVSLRATAYSIPTDRPEADGTLRWDRTAVLVVQVLGADGRVGLGYSYAGPGARDVVRGLLEPALADVDADDVGACWAAMVAGARDAGRPGLVAGAISAVDVALWDLRAKRRDLPLFRLLPTFRQSVPISASGGFTSYSVQELVDQLGGWVADGIPRVKMQVGLGVEEDVERIASVRDAIGPDAELLIDASGAYDCKSAIALAARVALETTGFEEPVPADHLAELRLVRESVPQQVAAGAHGYDPWYFRRMLDAGAVDLLQADATRCLGITGFLMAANLAHAHGIPFSAHAAPAIHCHAACAAPQLSRVEYFWDHARLEPMLFDGTPRPVGGELRPDPRRPGLGLALKVVDTRHLARE